MYRRASIVADCDVIYRYGEYMVLFCGDNDEIVISGYGTRALAAGHDYIDNDTRVLFSGGSNNACGKMAGNYMLLITIQIGTEANAFIVRDPEIIRLIQTAAAYIADRSH